MKLKASWLLRKAVLFSILLTKMGHFLGNNDKLCLSCFLDIAHFFEVLIIDEAIFEMFHLSSLPKKERKTFFLYIFLSLKEMHNNKLLCLYRTYLRYVLTKIFDLCIRISKAYSYEDKQSLSSYKTRSSILSNKRIFDPFVVK